MDSTNTRLETLTKELTLKKVFEEKFQINKDIEMERAHRTGKPGADRPRPIVVKFLRNKDRSTILQHTKDLKGTKIYLNEDYTDAISKKRT